jgi:transcriptional regulator GlxA family with amidase domain
LFPSWHGRILRERKRPTHLLTTTRLPLSAIAERVGYGNANYFTTIFSNQMGTAPGRYRKAHTPAKGG